MTDRERIIAALNIGPTWPWLAEGLADRLLAAGVTLPPAPAPRPEWPGLEDAWKVYYETYECFPVVGFSMTKAGRAALNAAAPVLWRALVAALPPNPSDTRYVRPEVRSTSWPILRSDLADMADPYDGGGK